MNIREKEKLELTGEFVSCLVQYLVFKKYLQGHLEE